MPSSEKIAFLFLTREGHHQPEMCEEYWAGNEDYTVYAHIADPEAHPGGWLEHARIGNWRPTLWGNISLVRAQMALLRAALKDRANGVFVFCSESCVPVRPFQELQRILKLDPRSRFGWKPWRTVEQTDPSKALRPTMAPRLPHTRWIFHSQWILHREAASLLVEDDLSRWFEDVFAPDECHPGTVLHAKGYPLQDRVVNADVTWADWQGGSSPVTLTNIDPRLASTLASNGVFFARKFQAASNVLSYGLHLCPEGK